MIQPDVERAEAKKIKATTLMLKSSHAAMLAQPKKVADFIIAATGYRGALPHPQGAQRRHCDCLSNGLKQLNSIVQAGYTSV